MFSHQCTCSSNNGKETGGNYCNDAVRVLTESVTRQRAKTFKWRTLQGCSHELYRSHHTTPAGLRRYNYTNMKGERELPECTAHKGKPETKSPSPTEHNRICSSVFEAFGPAMQAQFHDWKLYQVINFHCYSYTRKHATSLSLTDKCGQFGLLILRPFEEVRKN